MEGSFPNLASQILENGQKPCSAVSVENDETILVGRQPPSQSTWTINQHNLMKNLSIVLVALFLTLYAPAILAQKPTLPRPTPTPRPLPTPRPRPRAPRLGVWDAHPINSDWKLVPQPPPLP